jgi:protein TonB
MADRKPSSPNAGAPNPIVKFIPIVVILIGVGIAAYFFVPRGNNAPTPSATTTTGTPTPQAGAPAAPAAPVPELSKEQLIKEAGLAFREARYVAPPGNNALEYYLRVLEKEPNNQTATDALREMFPFATGAVEQDINAGSVDEATRVIDLLSKADPSNYTLTILRGKLDAKKKLTDQQQAQVAAAAAAAAANKAAAASAAAQNTPPAASATPAPDAAASTSAPAGNTNPGTAAPTRPTPAPAAPTAAPQTAAAAPAPAPVAAAATGESHGAEVVKTVPPVYPTEAFRKRQEGWVEVEFTVTADGKVSNAAVANSNPARVFNEAALRAVQAWSFKPKTENGTPVEERMKRRIEFKLAG